MRKNYYFETIKRRILTCAYASYPCDCAINLSSDLGDILFDGKYYTAKQRIKIVDAAINNLCNDGYINLYYKDKFKLTTIINLTEKGRLEAQEMCSSIIKKLFNIIKRIKLLSKIECVILSVIGSIIATMLIPDINTDAQLLNIIALMLAIR